MATGQLSRSWVIWLAIKIQDKSGSVALPRTKLVLAHVAALRALEAPTRALLDASEVLNRAVAMLMVKFCPLRNLFGLTAFLKLRVDCL